MRFVLAFVIGFILTALTFAVAAHACPPQVGAALGAPSCSYGIQSQSQVSSYVMTAPVAVAAAPVVYAPLQQVRVVQRVVVPQPIIQQQIVTPYVQQGFSLGYGGVQQQLLQSNVGYGGQAALGLNVGVNAGLGRGLFGGGSRTVTKTRTVTRTGRGGLINNILGR
jgi:hypothetical protein